MGSLTLHGVTKDISIEVKKVGEGKAPGEDTGLVFTGGRPLKRAISALHLTLARLAS